MQRRLRHYDAVVIGAGLSGLVAAAALTEAGARTYVVAKGGGYLHFTSGCVDVLGRDPRGRPVQDPLSACAELSAQWPAHPYALAGPRSLEGGVDLFRRVMASAGYPFVGDVSRTVSLPTSIGSTRITSLLPLSMAAGDLDRHEPMLIVGFTGFRDFYPQYLAANLVRRVPFAVHGLYLDLARLQGRRHLLSVDAARAFDDPSFRTEVARQLRVNLRGAGRVGFPAVLGLDRSREAVAHLEEAIGVPVFEIPTLPPSVAGIRIYHALRTWLLRHGARVEIGFWARGRRNGVRATGVAVEAAGREMIYEAETFVLATGGVGGGGILACPDGALQETVFHLPVGGSHDRTEWFRASFLGSEPQPISLAGVRADGQLRALLEGGTPLDNLFVTASTLPAWDPTREKSGEGVALATGFKAAQEGLKQGERGSLTTMAEGVE